MPTGRISTPTSRTTQAARTAPTVRSTQAGRTAPTSRTAPTRTTPARTTPGVRRDDWDRRDVDVRQHPEGRDRPPWRPVTLGDTARGPKTLSPSTRRMYQRRRRSMLLAFLLVSAVVLVVSQLAGPDHGQPDAAAPAPTVTLRPAAPTKPASAATVQPTAKARTTAAATTTKAPVTAALRDNGFDYAGGPGPVLGTSGTLRRFKVAVEQGEGQSAGDFAAAIERTLGDPRSWIRGEQFRLQRVSRAAGAEFTIFLASAATSQKMCARGGLHTAGYTSCRLASQVIINLDRWQKGIPNYGAPLATYQAYAINHEVGHQLGQGHEACPGAGKLAPVMQQQTYGLKGCTANAWPYVDGERYAGSPIA
jgi:hypothetical protein